MATEIELVRDALAPYHDEILSCVHQGFAEWRDVRAYRISMGYGSNLYSRTDSNEIFDAILRRAIPLLGIEEKIFVKQEAQTAKFIIRGVVARFKKAGDDGLGCSIPTQAAMAFMDAEQSLPGLPPETAKIEIVWTPNLIWTQVERVSVVARDNDVLVWEYEVTPNRGVGVVTPIVQTKSQDTDDLSNAASLVKPKASSNPDIAEK